MSIPIIKKETVMAVIHKASSEPPEKYVERNMVKLATGGQIDFATALVANAQGITAMVADNYPEAEMLEEIVIVALAAVSIMTYDMINAQIEADALTEMFAEQGGKKRGPAGVA